MENGNIMERLERELESVQRKYDDERVLNESLQGKLDEIRIEHQEREKRSLKDSLTARKENLKKDEEIET
jgi:hypothetical protein